MSRLSLTNKIGWIFSLHFISHFEFLPDVACIQILVFKVRVDDSILHDILGRC